MVCFQSRSLSPRVSRRKKKNRVLQFGIVSKCPPSPPLLFSFPRVASRAREKKIASVKGCPLLSPQRGTAAYGPLRGRSQDLGKSGGEEAHLIRSSMAPHRRCRCRCRHLSRFRCRCPSRSRQVQSSQSPKASFSFSSHSLAPSPRAGVSTSRRRREIPERANRSSALRPSFLSRGSRDLEGCGLWGCKFRRFRRILPRCPPGVVAILRRRHQFRALGCCSLLLFLH